MPGVMQALLWVIVGIAVLVIIWKIFSDAKRDRKNFERSLKMVPMLIHLPPSTDDIQAGGRGHVQRKGAAQEPRYFR